MGEIYDIGGLKLTRRCLEPSDLGQLVALTSQEYWPMSLEEFKLMHEAESRAFIGLFMDDGTLICHISMVFVAETFAYGGLYITSKPYRGRGIARRLYDYAIDLAKPRIVTLDAVVGKPKVYESSGFKLADVNIRRITGTVDTGCLAKNIDKPSINTRPLRKTDLDEVYKYDVTVTGFDRRKFLNLWLSSPSSVVLVARHTSSDKVCGYLVMREDYIGRKTGPLYKGAGFYADDPAIATQLLREIFLNHLPSDVSFWFEYPTLNQTVTEVIQQFGETHHVDSCTLQKMTYRGRMPDFGWTKVYSITNSFNSYI